MHVRRGKAIAGRRGTRPYPSLQAWMEATGTTQAQLAKRLGVGQPHISNVLRHTRKASFALALRLSRMTNVPIEAIAGDDLMSEISVR